MGSHWLEIKRFYCVFVQVVKAGLLRELSERQKIARQARSYTRVGLLAAVNLIEHAAIAEVFFLHFTPVAEGFFN